MSSGRGDPKPAIRLDAFLKNAGILKRRSLAQTYCEVGAVSVNGRTAKSGKQVHAGDRVRLDTWNRRLEFLVRSIPRKSGQRNQECYQILQDERKSQEEPH